MQARATMQSRETSGFCCPACGSNDHGVQDSRGLPRGYKPAPTIDVLFRKYAQHINAQTAWRRVRRCNACSHKWHTIELPRDVLEHLLNHTTFAAEMRAGEKIRDALGIEKV